MGRMMQIDGQVRKAGVEGVKGRKREGQKDSAGRTESH
jgi:hypothetical protein